MRTITNEEIKIAVRDAFNKGLLTAQAPKQSDRRCLYKVHCSYGITRYCAIGAVLTEYERADPNCAGTATNLQNFHIVQFQDIKFALEVQTCHDDWANSVGDRRELIKNYFYLLIKE